MGSVTGFVTLTALAAIFVKWSTQAHIGAVTESHPVLD